MATPTINFAFADFTDQVTGEHRVQLSPGYFGYTDENGELAFANIVPGIYVINAPGVSSLRITVPDETGPFDAVDLLNSGQDFIAPGATISGVDLPDGKMLVAGTNVTLTESGEQISINSSGLANVNGVVDFTGDNPELYSQGMDGSIIDLGPTYFQCTGPDGDGFLFQVANSAGSSSYVFGTDVEKNAGVTVWDFKNKDTTVVRLYGDGGIQTGSPNGGTAGIWKLGVKVDAVTTLDATKYLQVDIGGVLYKVALVTSA